MRSGATPRTPFNIRAVALCAATLLLCLLPLASAFGQSMLNLQSRALTLNPEDKTQQRVGGLVWRGGIAVTAIQGAFGGLSDLELDPDGMTLTAVTDQGQWLSASLTYNPAGHLTGITTARMGPLVDAAGKALSGKRQQDAEALTRFGDGTLVAAFERAHRLRRWPASGKGIAGPPQALAAPPALNGAGTNGGIEALVALADGRLLAFTEKQQNGDGYAVYLRDAPPPGAKPLGATPAGAKTPGTWHSLSLRPAGSFHPTGAALLPSGDVILLERRFTLLGGLAARLRRIALAEIRPGAVLVGEEIAEMRPPLTLDNFEGIAVHQAPDGTTRLTLISDDNFNALQRTLIVQFELLDEN
ncbi:hypothetical protein HBA54_24830 [Pelagibius litoralis]|uniref:Phytase-like domain-containing protein n=1 Tax=Pelagibius litoralis TaxID=374515 RepID=A0A967F2Q9_9PROT|nr:esterase-like activity of phytase family protein [Pelagibius litoralis]NIA71826.1 hypothetical protein [Pelagibius litoralis]